MKVEFANNPNIDLTQINTSMELDSGQRIAILTVDDYKIYIETQGYVRVEYNPRKGGRAQERGSETYRHASEFPPELMKLFHNGKADRSKKVYIDENNWFEIFVEKKGVLLESDVVDVEGYNPQELFCLLWDSYTEWEKELNK